jgi:hypothetical protein
MQLVRQSYGIAMAQCSFGGPTGVWLECTKCPASDKIKGAPLDISDRHAALIFRRGGWTGEGSRMLQAKCPKCSNLP